MGYPQKKFIFCDPCGEKRWAERKGKGYACRECGTAVNLARAASTERRRRQDSRAERTGSRKRDHAYMAWVASQACLHCGSPPPSHAHHSVSRARGGSDRTCVPLCHLCHGALHSQLGTTAKAFSAWGLPEPEKVLAQLWAEYEQESGNP